jgi:hypothetical protein
MKKLFAFLLFAGILSFIPSSLSPFFSSTLSAQIPSNGLVAWYPFNGNANDGSGNGNNGVVNGATLTADRNGTANSAYSFNGSNSIKIPYSSLYQSHTGSISLWIKENELPNSIQPQHVIFGQGWGFPQFLIRNTGKFRIQVANSISEFPGMDAVTSIGVNVWHHVVVVYDNNHFKISSKILTR